MSELEKLDKALKDLGYEVAKALGLIWLVNKLPFLELKPWVKERHDERG